MGNAATFLDTAAADGERLHVPGPPNGPGPGSADETLSAEHRAREQRSPDGKDNGAEGVIHLSEVVFGLLLGLMLFFVSYWWMGTITLSLVIGLVAGSLVAWVVRRRNLRHRLEA